MVAAERSEKGGPVVAELKAKAVLVEAVLVAETGAGGDNTEGKMAVVV